MKSWNHTYECPLQCLLTKTSPLFQTYRCRRCSLVTFHMFHNISLGPGKKSRFPSESCKLTNRPLSLSLSLSLSIYLSLYLSIYLFHLLAHSLTHSLRAPLSILDGPLVEDFVWRLAAVRSETPTRYTTSIFVPNLSSSRM